MIGGCSRPKSTSGMDVDERVDSLEQDYIAMLMTKSDVELMKKCLSDTKKDTVTISQKEERRRHKEYLRNKEAKFVILYKKVKANRALIKNSDMPKVNYFQLGTIGSIDKFLLENPTL